MYTVLLVDDEPAILDLEKAVIDEKLARFLVIGECYSVKDAIENLEKQRPDVVLTDIRMPGKSGVELIRYITEQYCAQGEKKRYTICVAVSAYSDFEYVHDSFIYGAVEYLLKPIQEKQMLDLFIRIESMLDNQESHEQEMLHNSENEMVDSIIQYIKAHISEDNSIPMISTRFGISQPYLSRLFKKHLSVTYNEYLTELRIKEARKLLEISDRLLIGEIAARVGFSDQFYFSKVFKSLVGKTPRAYRQENFVPGGNKDGQ